MRGRPLGFLAAVVVGWAGLRLAWLWPDQPVAPAVARWPTIASLPPHALARAVDVPLRPYAPLVLPPPAPDRRAMLRPPRMMTDAQMIAAFGLFFFVEQRPPPTTAAAAVPTPPLATPVGDAIGAAVVAARPAPSRWSLAAWLAARDGRADPRLGALLGASQAGARLSYALDDDRRLAAFVRVAAPLRHGGIETATGLQWRPTAAPVTGFVEGRRRADGRIVPATGIFGGRTALLPADFRLETYAQAGWVGGGTGGFAEGQARAARALGGTADVGIGAWGATQRGAARLDLGPSASVTLPIGRAGVRLSLDWRQRIAGRAAPGSGPVVTLGAGF